MEGGSILQGHKVAFLGHVHSLQGSIQPRLDLRPRSLLVARVDIPLTHQDLASVTQQNTPVTQLLDRLDRLLHLELVLTGVELLVEGVLDERVQQRVLSDIQHGGLGVREGREREDAWL